ncbi:MAG TPA: hypothetical protein VHZ25_03380 [Acidobacteriaceae bacterium]|jgi:hypothetical protein|nr:hypothetical protein [Acidobacteriaceae bacterium]
MTSRIRTIALAALVVVASLSQTLHAQTGAVRARVNVPFSFDCGKAHFAGGIYTLIQLSPNVLSIRANGTAAMAMIQINFDPRITKTSQVTFRQYGDRYFLEEISMAGSEAHVSVYESQSEKQAARELASRGGEATQVALVPLPERPAGN